MLVYDIITGICLFLMLLIAAYFLFRIFLEKNRSRRMEQLRAFKKGKCTAIFVVALLLYFIGEMYSALNGADSVLSLGEHIANSVIFSIKNTVSLIVLGYDINDVGELVRASVLYRWTIYVLYFLITVNAVIFTFSIMCQKVSYWYSNYCFRTSKCAVKRIIVGNNKNSRIIYKSCTPDSAVIFDSISDDDAKQLFDNDITYCQASNYECFDEWIVKYYSPDSEQSISVVINYENESDCFDLCHQIIEFVRCEDSRLQDLYGKTAIEYDTASMKMYQKLQFFVIGNPIHESLYNQIEQESLGFIHYINKYRLIAIDYIYHHPMAKYMDEKQLDYNTSLVKDDVSINCAFIGFGNTNRQVFLSSVANNQFLGGTTENPVQKPVQYHIFDKISSLQDKPICELPHSDICDKNLNYSYFRYYHEILDKLDTLKNTGLTEEAEAIKAKYLELPDKPANVTFHHCNINDYSFYQSLFQAFEGDNPNSNSVNFVVIAFGSDSENMDMANKIAAKQAEWQIANIRIFVKIRDHRLAQAYTLNLCKPHCYVIGDETEIIYNINTIENRKIERMAIERDLAYEDSSKRKAKFPESERNLYRSHPTIRLANIYACLSLRSKLNMIGLDFVDSSNEIEEFPFNKLYGDELYRNKLSANKADKDYNAARYCEIFVDGNTVKPKNLRTLMAIQEHNRWNSFMISCGYIPATIEEMNRYGFSAKSYELRRHGNITTIKGLVDFRNLVIEQLRKRQPDKSGQKSTEELTFEADVIKYDYDILDNVCLFLSQQGYKIIKKAEID